LQPRFTARRFWDVALRNRCTWSSIVAFCYNALAKAEIPEHHFRHWGIAFSNAVVERQFSITPVSWYGMTETLTHAIVSTPHLPTPYGAIGRAAPEYGIHILDDAGRPVEVGETGGLRIAGVPGVSLFKEYLNDPEATEKAYDDNGLFDTGDQIAVLEGGWLKFADRKKDMLKTGGENVASSEVEAVILAIHGIAECAVVGKPDDMRGEVPVAFVSVSAPLAGRPAAEIASVVTAACAERLARFKVPHDVRVVEDFPRANINKIAKAKLRDLI
jgi:crotonobetaine/carnitine-CoA ligase